MKTQIVESLVHPKFRRLQIQLRTNSRYYQCVTYLDGRLRQHSTKTTHLPTALKLAEDWYKREVRASQSFGQQHPVAKLTTDPTIAELFSSYCSELETRKRPYAKQKWGPIAEFWRARLLSSVDTDTIRDFLKWRRRQKAVKSNGTLHKDVVLLRQILKHAMDQDLLDDLPRFPSVGSISKNPRPWFTPKEWLHLDTLAVERILQAENSRVRQQRQDVHDFMTFLYASMVRVGELRSLRFHACRIERNDDGDRMLVCEVTGKRGTRTAIAHDVAVQIYERRLRDAAPSDLMFPHHCRDSFRQLLDAAGLRTDAVGFTRNLKSVRATSISAILLENPTINLTVVARNAGTSVQMIDTFYARRLTAEMNKQTLSAKPGGERGGRKSSVMSLEDRNALTRYFVARLAFAMQDIDEKEMEEVRLAVYDAAKKHPDTPVTVDEIERALAARRVPSPTS